MTMLNFNNGCPYLVVKLSEEWRVLVMIGQCTLNSVMNLLSVELFVTRGYLWVKNYILRTLVTYSTFKGYLKCGIIGRGVTTTRCPTGFHRVVLSSR